MAQEKNRETILELLRKVHELAKGGYEGEQKAATLKLNQLLRKYKLTIDDLSSSDLQEFHFNYSTKFDYYLIIQVYCKVTGNSQVKLNKYKKKRKVAIELTKAQGVEMSELYPIYRLAFAKEIQVLFNAFLYKHSLFGNPSDDKPEKELTPQEKEELLRTLAMANNLGNVNLPNKQKQLAGGSDGN